MAMLLLLLITDLEMLHTQIYIQNSPLDIIRNMIKNQICREMTEVRAYFCVMRQRTVEQEQIH